VPIRQLAAAAVRRRHRRQPCEIPAARHSLTYARFYVCGWRCDLHRPTPRDRTTDTPKDCE
jgi:hypothetical protein